MASTSLWSLASEDSILSIGSAGSVLAVAGSPAAAAAVFASVRHTFR